ncbi:aspartyl-phosphate phosphatase Spo0E family protein [Ammoniphilus sp. 3BR4]|uniref:aspartyl-phosphate phosphatase Spo0E family protein n=1 Tax=Ammoniphilus sp. 3BR4 TaxID=3158265 RepID=UPI0034650206
MILSGLYSLLNQLESKREVMHTLASIKGITDPEVLKVSQQLDELIVTYQTLVIGCVKKGGTNGSSSLWNL